MDQTPSQIVRLLRSADANERQKGLKLLYPEQSTIVLHSDEKQMTITCSDAPPTDGMLRASLWGCSLLCKSRGLNVVMMPAAEGPGPDGGGNGDRTPDLLVPGPKRLEIVPG